MNTPSQHHHHHHHQQLQKDAAFLLQQQHQQSNDHDTTTGSSTTDHTNENHKNENVICSLQLRNRLQLQIQDRLLSSVTSSSSVSSLYPWNTNMKTKTNKNSITTHHNHNNHNNNHNNEMIVRMQLWWKMIQTIVQINVTNVLHQLPISSIICLNHRDRSSNDDEYNEYDGSNNNKNEKESTAAAAFVLQVVPFASTIDPPFVNTMSHCHSSDSNHHDTTTATTTTKSTTTTTTTTIHMTVLFPMQYILEQYQLQQQPLQSRNKNHKTSNRTPNTDTTASVSVSSSSSIITSSVSSISSLFKNEIYFQYRQRMIQQIVHYLQRYYNHQQSKQQQPHDSSTNSTTTNSTTQVYIHPVDVRKSSIRIVVPVESGMMSHPHHPHRDTDDMDTDPNKTKNKRKSSSSSRLQSSSSSSLFLLNIVIDFQMNTIEWIQNSFLIRLLPNRCNNNTNNNNNNNNNKNHPNKNNNAITTTTTIATTTNDTASVQYNYAITEDMVYGLEQQLQQQQTVESTDTSLLLSNMNLRHGMTLIIVWCTQRGLYSNNNIYSNATNVITAAAAAAAAATTDRHMGRTGMTPSTPTPTNHLFNDTILFQIIHYLVRTKRIVLSSNDPMTVVLAFLTLLSETQWDCDNNKSNDDNDDDEMKVVGHDKTNTSQQKRRRQQQRQQHHHQRRTVLIQPQFIGQSMTEIVTNSMLAQRYASMIQDDIKSQQKKQQRQQQTNQEQSQQTTTTTTTSPPLTLVEFLSTTPNIRTPTLFHPTMQHNYMFRLSSSIISSAQIYAKKSLSCIYPIHNNVTISHTDPYQHLFGNNSNSIPLSLQASEAIFYTLHDAYMRIPMKDIILSSMPREGNMMATTTSSTTTSTPSLYNHHWMDDVTDLGYDEALIRGVLRTLRIALTDRTVQIQAIIVKDDVDNENHLDSNTKQRSHPAKKAKQKNTTKCAVVTKSTKSIIIGVTINPDTCYRVVDRCITADDHKNTIEPRQQEVGQQSRAVHEFLSLWGSKAELRRFKDGAIVYAAVWDNTTTRNKERSNDDDDAPLAQLRYHNDDTWQGGIVESIMCHILTRHFLKPDATTIPCFMLRDIISMIDGIRVANSTSNTTVDTSSSVSTPTVAPLLTNPMVAHRSVMKAFDSLSDWLRKNSTPTIPIPGSATAMKSVLGIPLTIDRVEPLSPALRYVTLYPPLPHPLLYGSSGSTSILGQKKCSGAVQSDPILVQLCFGPSSKWPNDLKAIGAAKTAMLIEIVNGIVQLKKNSTGDDVSQCFNENSILVTPSYADVPFMGYVFRVTIKADHEIKILQQLQNPSRDAARMLQSYMKQSIIAAKHHALIHGVYTSHPSSSATVRLVKRWLSSHLISSDCDDGYCIPFEVIELTVAFVYTDQSSLIGPPATVTSGFLRWLSFIMNYNWMKRPLVVDPQCHINDAAHCAILDQFEMDRGKNYDRGPAWYIVAPYDRMMNQIENVDPTPRQRNKNQVWSPSFASTYPERVVASRIIAITQRTFCYLQGVVMRYDDSSSSNKRSDSIWHTMFQENRDSFLSYSALLRIDPSFLVNANASSSAGVRQLLPQTVMTKASDASSSDVEIMESNYTRSMQRLAIGPKDLAKKMYRNLLLESDNSNDNTLSVLTEWHPIRAMIQLLRTRFGQLLLLFYNELYPEVIGIVWRKPNMFVSRSFSALTSEYARPVIASTTAVDDDDNNNSWQSDTMISYNVHDIVRSISMYTPTFVTDMKVMDYGSAAELNNHSSMMVVAANVVEGGKGNYGSKSKTNKPTKRQRVAALSDDDDADE